MKGPLYFGCWDRCPGHGVHEPSGRGLNYYDVRAGLRLPLDGGYPPRSDEREHDFWRRSSDEVQPQGAACLHHEDERTILAFWDRTVDDRRSSHSTFLLPGVLTFDEAVAAARVAFPHIWARLDAAGVIVRPAPRARL